MGQTSARRAEISAVAETLDVSGSLQTKIYRVLLGFEFLTAVIFGVPCLTFCIFWGGWINAVILELHISNCIFV